MLWVNVCDHYKYFNSFSAGTVLYVIIRRIKTVLALKGLTSVIAIEEGCGM